MSKCILKGIHTDSIDKTDYSSIKQCYQRWIAALLKKGFSLDSIRIYFDDENRQIHLDHEPDEIDAMILYAEYEDKLQEHFTQFPFCEAWGGHRYRLWHNKSFEKYLSDIHHSCDIYTELSKKEYLPEKWQFSQKDHGYLSISERKAKIKQSLYELRKQGNQHQGIFINEIHHHQFPKRFIKENLDYFKELGIKTLFFEFLFYERHQLLLDEYFCSEHDELPPELACYLNFKDKASGCGFSGYTDIVKAAKKAGIRIVALDSYASILTTTRTFQAHFHHDDRVRLKSFNGQAARIIEQEHDNEPYLVFLGMDHGYVNGHSLYKNIKSVAELLPFTCSMFLSDQLMITGHLPFFSHQKAIQFGYSRYKAEEKIAGVHIVESSWLMHSNCKL